MAAELSNFHPGSAGTVCVYANGSCQRTSFGPAAGYSVYIDHEDLYRVSVCEPLESTLQTSQHADLKAMQSALELVLALRPRHAVVRTNSQYAANGYNVSMYSWSNNDWCKADGNPIAHKSCWQLLRDMPNQFSARFMDIDVEWITNTSDSDFHTSRQLARQACSLHKTCTYCRHNVGRDTNSHHCEPVCVQGSCDGDRVFPSRKAWNQHQEACHSITHPCRHPRCNFVFGSKAAAEDHEWAVHSDYVIECDYCTDLFQCEDDKDQHERNKCDYSPYCRSCDRWFGAMHSLEQHDRDYHNC